MSTNETIKNKRNYYSTQVSFVFVFILNPAPLTWVYCSSNDSSQRVPGPVIKPVMKFIKSLLSQKPGSPIIKIPKARMKKKKTVSPPLPTQLLVLISSGFRTSGYTTEKLMIT